MHDSKPSNLIEPVESGPERINHRPPLKSFGFLWGSITLIAALTLVFSSAYPPMQDLGEWIYQAYLAKYLLTHQLNFAALKTWPVPNSISEILMAALMLVMSPVAAARAFVSLYILLGSLISFKLGRIYGRSDHGNLFVLLIALLVFPTPFWTGELNYQIGLMLLATYMFAFSRKHSNRHYSATIRCAVFAVLIFFSHAICLAIFVIFCTIQAIQRRNIIATTLALFPAGFLSLAYLYFNSRMENTESELVPTLHGIRDLIAYRVYVLCKLGPYGDMILGNVGDFIRARPIYMVGTIFNLLFAALLVVLLSVWLVHHLQKKLWSPEFLTSAVCIALYLWDPAKLVRVATIGERLLLPAIITVVLTSSGLFKIRAAASVVAGCLCLMLIYWCTIVPKSQLNGYISNGAINDPGKRYQLLFWHVPFSFAGKVFAAQQSSLKQEPPLNPLSFKTSLLRAK